MMRVVLVAMAVAVCSFASAGEPAMPPAQIAKEMKYAEELRKLGLDDFANTVIDRIPDQKNKAVILAKFQAFLHRNLKDEKKIEAHIRKQAGDDAELYWMMRIRLADAYWAWGKPEKCFKIYEEFMEFYEKLLERSKEPEERKRTGVIG